MKKSLPRGIRNNNPLNIRRTSDKWRGLAPTQSDPAFCQFTAPEWGVRAAIVILRSYQRRYHLHTLTEVLHRYAPTNENHTERYIERVSTRAKIQRDVPLDLANRDLVYRLIEAMWQVECGVPGDPTAINKGLDLAGL